MEAIGLNPIRLDAIGIDPIRLNAIRLGVPGASSGSVRPYIDPEVLASLVAVCICDGKSNNDPDRAIIKNLVDPDNPFIASNFAWKANSGYGKYEEDFTSWVSSPKTNTTDNKITVQQDFNKGWISYIAANGRNIPAFKVEVSGIPDGGILMYGGDIHTKVLSNGINELPERIEANAFGFKTKNTADWSKLTITQIPSFQGALVTDGVDDMIVSQKSINEMLDESDEVTVVSMIHQIGYFNISNTRNNFLFGIDSSFTYLDNIINDIGKTGIYGYTYKNSNITVINNILGDKSDYNVQKSTDNTIKDVYSVEGYITKNGDVVGTSKVAWYWTFIANKVLTTDEINQVIAYYNLDKYVKPDVYYDVKKQGLSNDTPDADWYLKDFSGNGRDMQLYNFGKKLGSGVGEYKEDFTNWQQTYAGTAIISHDKLRINKASDINNGFFIAWKSSAEIKAFRAKITGIHKGQSIRYIYVKDKFRESVTIDTDGEYDFPHSLVYASGVGFTVNSDFPKESYIGVTIEQIPNYEGALVFDGVEDYGQFVGDLGLKDYTVAVDRAYPSLKGNGVPVISSIKDNTSTPFLFEFADNTSVVRPYSFGATTVLSPMELSRKISYQSTYIYDGTAINKGAIGNTGNGLTIGRFGIDTQYANIALWSLLLFPYTLSEFLLERQLKKYKLGTLYPDMVEFRPIINSNHEYTNIIFRNTTNGDNLEIGEYYDLQSISIFIQPINIDEVSAVKVNGIKAEFHSYDSNSKYYRYDAIVTKSPQKIDITIDEYIRYEDIVQPYPINVKLKDNKTNKLYTYGDKIKVGTELKYVGFTNLLPELYKKVGDIKLNGKNFDSKHTVIIEKTNVFTLTSPCEYLKANEPNCIADPQRLRIPNSSYKILGYIPDISGHGNHLKINNSAYAGMSGANGYKYDWNTWTIVTGSNVERTDSLFTNKLAITTPTCGILPPRNTVTGTFKIKVEGLKTGNIYWTYRESEETYKQFYIYNDGEYELPAPISESDGTGFIFNTGTNAGVIVRQIGEYEGSFCLDGVDDFITIPTLSHGAKQVLMKVNNQKLGTLIFDERINGTRMFINSQNDTIAYNDSDVCYIDGIRNLNIKTNDLLNVTHNITCLTSNTNMGTPVIGKYKAEDKYYAQMALFAFMSFDDISSEEEIKELNDIVGIEGGYVESPDYYWDAYGKSNTQADDIDNGIRGVINSKCTIFDKSIAGLAAIEQTNIDGKVGRVYYRALSSRNFVFNEESGYVDNGLVSDGVDDHLINTVIPAFTDFTVIAKRRKLSASGQFMQKGLTDASSAFILEKSYIGTDLAREYSFGGAKDLPYQNADITFCTKSSYNGASLSIGSQLDSSGLLIGKTNEDTLFWKGVFYKMMLYSKTIDMLSINMLKNLFERDELIDVNNPIFKQNN